MFVKSLVDHDAAFTALVDSRIAKAERATAFVIRFAQLLVSLALVDNPVFADTMMATMTTALGVIEADRVIGFTGVFLGDVNCFAHILVAKTTTALGVTETERIGFLAGVVVGDFGDVFGKISACTIVAVMATALKVTEADRICRDALSTVGESGTGDAGQCDSNSREHFPI